MFRRGTVLLVCIASVFADEKTPPPEKSTPQPEDAIAVAKREFDAVKAARTASDQTKLGLPQFQAPDFQPVATMGGSPFLQSPKDKNAAALKKKNANWLVDAMTESEKEQGKKRTGDDPRRKLSDESTAENERDSLDPTESKTEKNDPVEKKNPEPEANPLDRYMASWMTPQDLSLLRPSLASGASPQNLAGLDSSAANLSASLPGSAANDSLGLLSSAPAPVLTTQPRDNPFLQALTSPASALTGLAPANTLPMTVQPAAPATQATPPPTQVAPRSVKPDFVKPREDDKYYKPMKRF